VKSLNDKPGILALAMDRKVDPVTKQVKLEAVPFVVPGARFNEKYGWDSVSASTPAGFFPGTANTLVVFHGPRSAC
jgi:hypothetical protein